MDRMTERITNKDTGDVLAYRTKTTRKIVEAIQKLGRLEDLEEQEKLLQLPCNIGDWVWVVKSYGFIDCHKVSSIEIEESGVYLKSSKLFGKIEDFGRTIFYAKEEAEAALKKMNGMEE